METQYQQFAAWLQTSLGQYLLRVEQRELYTLWQKAHGDYLVSLATTAQEHLTQESLAKQKVMINPDMPLIGTRVVAGAVGGFMSFLPDSVDIVLLPHTLDFTTDPYKLLREIDIILRPDGYVVIIGFNPCSLWGLRRFFSFRQKAPWSGRFRWPSRVRDWLQLLNFEVLQNKYALYRPPIMQEQVLACTGFLEWLGRYGFSIFGGIYMILARKKTFYVKPLRSGWEKLAKVLSSHGVMEPATRRVNYNE